MTRPCSSADYSAVVDPIGSGILVTRCPLPPLSNQLQQWPTGWNSGPEIRPKHPTQRRNKIKRKWRKRRRHKFECRPLHPHAGPICRDSRRWSTMSSGWHGRPLRDPHTCRPGNGAWPPARTWRTPRHLSTAGMNDGSILSMAGENSNPKFNEWMMLQLTRDRTRHLSGDYSLVSHICIFVIQ